MDPFGIFKVSASALAAQRERMNVIASNLANVHSTRSEDGGPYTRRDVLFSAEPLEEGETPLEGVKVTGIVKDTSSYNMVYDPGHPDADAEGFVPMPNVNVIEEMVNMMMAFRAYESSVAAFNTSKAMLQKALELGRV